ncbi:hypothetical protein DSO57_1028615 [Entomophthora muscae]|uniref:Uncharacterized protein n=1 Tax=Entomophthora muscae TaxID=34485 RepID=A0ACC2TZP0_9FUNG|nr:hypothetical protein DSO57_1028615 [Entomophthora muscae]
MEGTQQQSSNPPIVRCGCGCPCRPKIESCNTGAYSGKRQEREFNSEVALTQPVRGAQHARVRSINPRVPKLTWKPTKVTTTCQRFLP